MNTIQRFQCEKKLEKKPFHVLCVLQSCITKLPTQIEKCFLFWWIFCICGLTPGI